jgi:hypothetical protein
MSQTKEELDELVQSRLDGEPDLAWYVRHLRQKCERWLSTLKDVKTGEDNKWCKEVMRKLNADHRFEEFMLDGAMKLIAEELTKQPAPNIGAERIG